MRTRRLSALVSVLLAALLLLGACARTTRPTVAEWKPSWQAALAGIPQPDQLGDPPDPRVCADTLARIREIAPDLRLTPDLAIDDTVADWLSVAESAFFECPPETGEISSFEEAYTELQRLQGEIEVVLTDLGG